MQFSIITPSFRNSAWLKLCVASVADQPVELEHLVQDSVSDDGTLDWLPQDRRVKAFIEKDQGMYDAVNRGLRRAQGDILAYLNCDEQYLPGALSAVADFFRRNPAVELVFADALVVNEDGSFNCFRKVQIPWAQHARVCFLCTLTCSMFFRRSMITERQHFFNDGYQAVGDADWVIRAMEKRVPMKVLRHYTSAFTETGDNLALRPHAQLEVRQFSAQAPAWARRSRGLISAAYRVSRMLRGGYHQAPLTYSIYTQAQPETRAAFHVAKPAPFWTRRPIAPGPAALARIGP